jgi:hypothetical protein
VRTDLSGSCQTLPHDKQPAGGKTALVLHCSPRGPRPGGEDR